MSEQRPPRNIDALDTALKVVVADLALRAAHTEDLYSLMQEASEMVASGLGIGHADVLEFLPSRHVLRVCAGVGWRPGIVGVATFRADLRSPAGFALQSGRPVVSEDLAGEHRFRAAGLLQEHRIRSVANVVIRGREGPFGVLEAGSAKRKSFSSEEVTFLQSIADLLAAAVDRARADHRLALAAEQQAALLRDLQHRMRNDLQAIINLVYIQLRRTRDPATRPPLVFIRHCLEALRLVHDQGDFETPRRRLMLDVYLRALSASVFRSGTDREFGLDLRLDPVEVEAELAVSLGLIMIEFLTGGQAPDEAGTIEIRLERLASGTGRLTLAHRPPQPDRRAGRADAWKLIELLAAHAGIRLQRPSGRGGHLA
ncbi:GAF domain-containing protein, partial [Arenibaculum sp.]|uniref:GAF domain-containing protein n=1 Tax=Arenibaculum sp. TaxID=2865862 RepID=UPI002E0F21DE|nr:GAF domain-containing protein [Arenibaculum sp.]